MHQNFQESKYDIKQSFYLYDIKQFFLLNINLSYLELFLLNYLSRPLEM